MLSIPFAVSGRWGLLGVGFNNDLGLHLAWAEWLRSGFGPTPEPGYPLGPHGLAVAVAAVPGIGLGQAFVGEIFAIGVLTGLTALGALREPRRRGGAPSPRRWSPSPTSPPPTSPRPPSRRPPRRSSSSPSRSASTSSTRLRSASSLHGGSTASRPGCGCALPLLALAGGIFFSYSFAGLAWPVAILALWSLTLPAVRRALRPRALLRFLLRPVTLLDDRRRWPGSRWSVTVVGPFGFARGFNKVAGSNTYGPVSPVEALGVWPASNYRLDAAGGAPLAGLAGAIGVLALLVGVAWWVRRRELAVPIALGACAVLYLASLPFSGDYSQAKALMIAAPLAMLVAIRPLLAEFRSAAGRGRARLDVATRSPGAAGGRWAVLAVAFVGGAVYSSFLALRDAPVGPPGHGAELRAFLPIVHGEPVLYAGQDRYAAYGLLGADTHVPLVEFPDAAVSPNPEKPFDTGDAYSPIDFDSFSRGDARPLPLRDHRPRRLEQPGAAQLQAGRRHPLLRALEADRADAARGPPRPARGDRGRRRWPAAPRRRSASCSPTPAAPRSSPTR